MTNSVRRFIVISAFLSLIAPGCYGWQVAPVPEPTSTAASKPAGEPTKQNLEISDTLGLDVELALRPSRGLKPLAPNRLLMIGEDGLLRTVEGEPTTCVAADGHAVPCLIGSGIDATASTSAQGVATGTSQSGAPASGKNSAAVKSDTATGRGPQGQAVSRPAASVSTQLSATAPIVACTDTGKVNSIVCTVPNVTAYTAGMTVYVIPAAGNTGSVTINVNGLGSVAVTKNGSAALSGGELLTAAVAQLQYDGTRFQVLNGLPGWIDNGSVLTTLPGRTLEIGAALPAGAPSGTLVANVIYSPNAALNVKAFGATGNGTTDDTTAIQSAIKALGGAGGAIYFPCGSYLVSSGLRISYNAQSVKGESAKCATILANYAGNTPVLLLKSTTTGMSITENEVSNLAIVAGGSAPNVGIQLDFAVKANIHDVFIYGVGVSALDLLTVWEGRVHSLEVIDSGLSGSALSGIIHFGSSPTARAGGSTQTNLSDVILGGNVGTQIAMFDASGTSGINISDLTIENSPSFDVTQENNAIIHLANTTSIHFTNVIITVPSHVKNQSRDVIWNDTTSYANNDVQLVNTTFIMNGAGAVVHSVINTGAWSAAPSLSCYNCYFNDVYTAVPANQFVVGSQSITLHDAGFYSRRSSAQLFAAGLPVNGNGYVFAGSATTYWSRNDSTGTSYEGPLEVTGNVTVGGNIRGATLSLTSLPTLCSGNPTGTIWNNAGTLGICP